MVVGLGVGHSEKCERTQVLQLQDSKGQLQGSEEALLELGHFEKQKKYAETRACIWISFEVQ